MQILSRLCLTADGYVTTPDGMPPQVIDPAHGPGSHGIREFITSCEAVLMGRTTFEPALNADPWPWPDLKVFVLGSHRTPGAPQDVVFESDPVKLLERLRADNRGGDVHLVGGPSTIESFHALGAVDKLELVVLPFMVGSGMRLTESLNPATKLSFESSRVLPAGSVEIVYSLRRP
ncbi:MAG TPA: dihydrofolate reductase family protein [Actinocrinis sp.]|nr:dihydrofolate reductase family protein [Actinocrinis sp.]